MTYDHLVLALGAVSNYLGNDAVREHSLDFKSLGDAIRVRNAVIAAFDAADAEPDPDKRRARLTFVIAGGGFSGAELAGALNDFARGMLADYPRLSADDLRVIVVHSRERILPELSESLAAYALERMQARGVTFKLNARVTDARQGAVDHPDQREGRRTARRARGDQHGDARVDSRFRSQSRAQSAARRTRQTRSRRHRVHAGRQRPHGRVGRWATALPCQTRRPASPVPAPRNSPLGRLRISRAISRPSCTDTNRRVFTSMRSARFCVVGHQTACAEIRGYRFSGFFAWVLWRGIYWLKLPGLERKVRVASDWLIELFFPRDIVQTLDLNERRGEMGSPPRVQEHAKSRQPNPAPSRA